MSRAHCSAPIRCAGATVSVIAAFETHTSMSSNDGSGVLHEVEGQVAAGVAVERDHLEAVRAQASAIAAPIPRAAPVTSAFGIVPGGY